MYKLETKQKSKLADFAVNIAVAWFVGSVITPFFDNNLVYQIGFDKIIGGLFASLLFVISSLIIA